MFNPHQIIHCIHLLELNQNHALFQDLSFATWATNMQNC